MNRTLILLLCFALAATGCAGSQRTHIATPGTGPEPNTRVLLAEYVQKLPVGSRVRVGRASGDVLKGTLIKTTDQAIVLQRRSRLPEPPVELPLSDVLSVSLESPNAGVGKAVGVGVAVGAGTALGVFLLLVTAVFGD